MTAALHYPIPCLYNLPYSHFVHDAANGKPTSKGKSIMSEQQKHLQAYVNDMYGVEKHALLVIPVARNPWSACDRLTD